MTINPDNIISGIGVFRIGAFGAVEPADSAMSPYTLPDSTVWTDIGGTTGGFVWEDDLPSTDLPVDQLLGPAGARYTAGSAMSTITVTMAEATLANYALVWQNLITTTSGTGWIKQEPIVGGVPPLPKYVAIMLDGPGPGGFMRRLIGRKCLPKPKIQHTMAQDGKIAGLAATWTLYEVSNSIPRWAKLDQTA